MKVSVVIPAYDEEKNIGRCIKSVLKQRYEELEVIVVDDASTDKTVKIAKNLGVKILSNKKNLGLAKSLNRGIKAAKGKIAITLHTDCELIGRDWITKIVSSFDDTDVAAVTGNRIFDIDPNASLLEKINLYFAGAYATVNSNKIIKSDILANKFDAYRKSALKEVNYFNERFKVSGEDIDLCCKLRNKGKNLLLNPKCKVKMHLSSHQMGFLKNLKKRFSFGRAVPRLLIDHLPQLLMNKTWLISTIPYMFYFLCFVLLPINRIFLFLALFINILLCVRVLRLLGIKASLLAFVLIPIYTIAWNMGIIYGLFIVNRKII